jgi:hypothetical protein
MTPYPYIYEHIRCKGFEVRHIEQHLARLDALSKAVLMTPSGVTYDALHLKVAEALREEGYSSQHANVVVVRCYGGGEFEVEPLECLYDEFSLRALRPQCHLCNYSGEFIVRNTSAKESLLEIERSRAVATDRSVSMWRSDEGEIVAIDGAPVVAVFDDEIRFSRMGEGVEFDIAFGVAEMGRRSVTRGAIMEEDLLSAKELFTVDYRGITSILSFASKAYMDIVAEKLARQVADTER